MAGIFTDQINSRDEFFVVLDRAKRSIAHVLARRTQDATLLSVQKQLDAIDRWTADGRVPTIEERTSLDMALRMFREFRDDRG